ncbi:hypothetical protein D9611_009128 [Ephemerocybe angulata]|uniref:Uncharacterized protein n=1 Tax=Ephemerocybe angulata TaxID=980116 RepID=A0A8H5CG29_9AGAR|nr:hypothetical protein D9611_009128 [Tulosesus angulatus]
MVYVSKPLVVAALVITPSIAAPLTQVSEEQFEARDQYEDLDARGKFAVARRVLHHTNTAAGHIGTATSLWSMIKGQRDIDSDLEARGKGWELGKKMFASGAAAAAFGTLIAPIFKRPAKPVYNRDFEEEMYERDFEDDVFERDFDDEELELLARYLDEAAALEGRSPNYGASLLKIGTFLGRKAKFLVPAAGAAGFGLGVAAKLRSRDFDEFDIYERDMESSLDEMD